MAKFTPGPWNLVNKFAEDGDAYGDAEIHAPLRYPIVLLEICDEEARANAHLIAAAPEMYEALKACAVELRDIEVMQELGGCKSERHLAEAAIAKAEGR